MTRALVPSALLLALSACPAEVPSETPTSAPPAPPPAHGSALSCAEPEPLCGAANACLADEHAAHVPQLEAIALGLRCAEERPRACTLEAAVDLLGRTWSGPWGESIGARALDTLARACEQGSVESCEAVFVHYRDAPSFHQDPKRMAADLGSACFGGHELACSRLAHECRQGRCALEAAGSAFARGCSHTPCFEEAARLEEEAGDRASALSLFANGCAAGGSGACTDAGRVARDAGAAEHTRVAREIVARCGAAPHCSALEAQFFASAHDYRRARDAFDEACRAGDDEACERLAWALLALPPPDDERGIGLLDERCVARGEVASCYALARIFHEGGSVRADRPRSARYARLACDKGEPMACDWQTTSTGTGSDGRPLLERVVDMLVSPLRMLP